MPDIILATLNAKYIHTAFGLRYLLANLDELRPRARLMEFDLNQRPLDVAEAVLAQDPKVVGLGVHIWNAAESAELVAILKRVRPEVVVVLGGPEVSYETEQQAIVQLADHVITGEADLTFATVCRQLLTGQRPAARIIPAELPDFTRLVLPYDVYSEEDIAHRILYVEASRGCPFGCEFCLSSLDVPLRRAPLPRFLEALQGLLDRGARHFKFVDRTFNVDLRACRAVLEFLLPRWRPGRFFHFEMVPDRLPAPLRELIARFPPGALQFEIGVQSFNPEVCRRVGRRQDFRRLEENLRFLRQQSGVHLHTDLIAGLPGESLKSFAAGFDRLVALGPQEIQVGMLKRLRGTPIGRHDAQWQMLYNPQPPYDLLQNSLLDFTTLQQLRRFARYWDLVANSGHFIESAPLLWSTGTQAPQRATAPTNGLAPPPTAASSPFWSFLRWSEWLYQQARRTDSIALSRLVEYLFSYLTRELNLGPKPTAQTLFRDWQRSGQPDPPLVLREHLDDKPKAHLPAGRPAGLRRQARHQSAERDSK